MAYPELPCMEHQRCRRESWLFNTIDRISEKRMAKRGHMHTYLMSPPCIDPDIEKRIAIHLLKHAVACPCILSLDRRIGCAELLPVPWISLDAFLNDPFLGCEESLRDRILVLLGLVGAELCLQPVMAFQCPCYDHDT